MDNKKIPLIIAGIFLIIIIIAAFFIYPNKKYAIIVNNEKLSMESFESAMKDEVRFAQTRGEEVNEEKIKEDLIKRLVERMIFSSYLASHDIEVSGDDLDEIYTMMAEDDPNANNKEELHQQWKEQGRDINIIEKQLKEDLVYERLFEIYFEKAEVSEEELKEAYREHTEGMEEFGWDEISEEDLLLLLKYNKTNELIETERKRFEENVEIKLFI